MIDPRTGKRGPSLFAVSQTMDKARRNYAAGNYRAAAKLVGEAFQMLQQVQAYETQQYAKRLTAVLESMESVNVLAKELVDKKREAENEPTKH